METQIMVQKPLVLEGEKSCQESVQCAGGTVYKTKLACGCCFCESVSCFCEWHKEAGGYWSN